MTTNDTLPGESRWLDDELNVLRWRAERLIDLGYGQREAVRLAGTQVDIHELDRLIGMGCPLDTAVRIAA
jgi:hypothetical protein